jgi:hypothetical protein
LGSFLKITEVAQNFLAAFFHEKRLCIILDRNGLGYILGNFFTYSSGHPDANPRYSSFKIKAASASACFYLTVHSALTRQSIC